MSIQDLSITNNQKKNLVKQIKDPMVLIQDENSELIINVEAYLAYRETTNSKPLEEILGEGILDFSAEYFVIS